MAKLYIGGGDFSPSRDSNIDSAKFYLIFLVLFGHVLLQSQSFYSDRLINATISWIWTFHMPAFVFISGYLTNLNKDKRQIIKSSFKILVSYVIMQTIMSLLYGSSLYEYLLIPQYAMWYLLALPIWRMITFFILKSGISKMWLLILTVALAAISGFIPIGKELAFQRVLSFYPMFIFGICARDCNLLATIRDRYKLACILLLAAIYILFVVGNRMVLTGTCSSVYESVGQMLFRCGSLAIGCLMSIAFICCVPSTSLSAKYGKNTLFIYCYHVFFVFQIIPLLWQKIGITPNIFVIIVYSLIIFALLCFLSNSRFLNKIISPIK